MSKDQTDRYLGVLLEDIQDNIKRMAEAMTSLIAKVDRIDIRLVRVEEKVDLMLPVLNAAVKDQSKQLNSHERRIKKLERVR